MDASTAATASAVTSLQRATELMNTTLQMQLEGDDRQPRYKSGLIAKPVYQCSQSQTIFLSYCRELHCQSTAGLCTLHNCVGPDLSLLDKKFKLDRRTHTP